jgi:hypothetical protein
MKSDRLEQECRTYTRYLIGQQPTEYVIAKYKGYHQLFKRETTRFDSFLVNLSARAPWLTAMVDGYAVRFRKHSPVRSKLVLTLALLECSAPSFRYLDETDASQPSILYLSLGLRVAAHIVMLLVAIIVFLPVQLIARGRRY